MKVLILSAEVWQDGMNGGNVLSNIFAGQDFEFAQIYCNPGQPKNTLCKKYYQMTDAMVFRNLLKRKTIGKNFVIDNENLLNEEQIAEQPNKKVYGFFHRFRLPVFYALKGLMWNLSKWKNQRLKDFIDEFNPDIIFAPCYGSTFMLKLTNFVAKYTGKKVISYISDDSYTLKQFRFAPSYWISRFCVRRWMRKTFPLYSLVYTMTEEQKEQCEKDFGANMKILRKSAPFNIVKDKTHVNKPIRIVYAGGIYLNRHKTLKMLVNEIKLVNKEQTRFQLDIYTGNEITSRINKALNDGVNSNIHSAVSQDELKEIYATSDIALHVESFDIKNRLAVRMSFSTKIVDCLSCGCAVMAICDKKQAGFLYLKNEDAAMCASSKQEIRDWLSSILNEPSLVLQYANKAKKLCEVNHSQVDVFDMIKSDFENLVADK